MAAIADSWLAALPVLSNNWEHTGFNFTTMTPTDAAWVEPDMAIGIAWLEYMAYVQFHDARYLAAADTCMTQMNSRPPIRSMKRWAFSARRWPPAERGVGSQLFHRQTPELGLCSQLRCPARLGVREWALGNYDAYGLMGSTTDSSGYAFSMNTYAAAGIITPVVRYAPQYARLIGRWLLHVAANASLFYPNTLPDEHAVERRLGAADRRAKHLVRRAFVISAPRHLTRRATPPSRSRI